MWLGQLPRTAINETQRAAVMIEQDGGVYGLLHRFGMNHTQYWCTISESGSVGLYPGYRR